MLHITVLDTAYTIFRVPVITTSLRAITLFQMVAAHRQNVNYSVSPDEIPSGVI